MSSKTEEKPNQEEVGVLAGLLDFYSDRAEAQASFLIACVFGLFACTHVKLKNLGLPTKLSGGRCTVILKALATNLLSLVL